MNEAGIIVLLLLNGESDRPMEIGTDVSEIVEYIKKKTAFTNYDSLEGDYI